MHTIDINASQAEFILNTTQRQYLSAETISTLEMISRLMEFPWREVKLSSQEHYIISMLCQLEQEKRHPLVNAQFHEMATDIARRALGISTLEIRRSDSADFHDVSVWQVERALTLAFQAGIAQGMKLADEAKAA